MILPLQIRLDICDDRLEFASVSNGVEVMRQQRMKLPAYAPAVINQSTQFRQGLVMTTQQDERFDVGNTERVIRRAERVLCIESLDNGFEQVPCLRFTARHKQQVTQIDGFLDIGRIDLR